METEGEEGDDVAAKHAQVQRGRLHAAATYKIMNDENSHTTGTNKTKIFAARGGKRGGGNQDLS